MIWTRQLGLVFGATVYAFSLILAVFLAGLGIGSSVGTVLVRVLPRPRVALGWCQLLLAGAVIWAAHLLSGSLPYWPVEEARASGALLVAQLDVFRCALVVLPGAMLWGASFPLAVAAAAGPDHDGAVLVGRLYAANTFGAVAGAVDGKSDDRRVRQPCRRTRAGGAARGFRARTARAVPANACACSAPTAAALVVAGGAAIAALSLVPAISPVPGELIAYGRYSAAWMGVTRIVYVGGRHERIDRRVARL